MYSSIALVTGKAKSVLLESGEHKVTDMSFCLITTFERILRDEFTTAAQVSSAEDSIARTLKQRLVGGSKANNLEKKCFEDDCIDMSLIAIDIHSTTHKHYIYCVQRQAAISAVTTNPICRQPGLPATLSLLAVHTNSRRQRSSRAERVLLVRYANPDGAHQATRHRDNPLRAHGF